MGVLWKLIGAGLRWTMIRWLQAWLQNSLKWIVYREYRECAGGLGCFAKGSVISLLLFLVNINDWCRRLRGAG